MNLINYKHNQIPNILTEYLFSYNKEKITPPPQVHTMSQIFLLFSNDEMLFSCVIQNCMWAVRIFVMEVLFMFMIRRFNMEDTKE